MFSEISNAILHLTLGADVPEIVIAHGARSRLETLVQEKGFTHPLVITDRTIFHATIGGECAYPTHVFETSPHPHMHHAATLLQGYPHADALIALGSGTINDIVKHAAYRAHLPYVCIPTAPSMNGYGSRNASLIDEGKKTSVAGALPVAIIADTALLTQAPMRMIKAGLGDSMARPTAQADWLLAHQVQGSAYDARVFEITQGIEAEVFAQVERLLTRDERAVAHLTELLILSGLGMTIAGSSAPASGGEHAIAHVIEALHGNPAQTLHGEQIAYTSQRMAKIQHSPMYHTLHTIAQRAGLPTTPEELGWEPAWVEEAIRLAPSMRPRYGYLSQNL